ncbi:aminodeoxychorismate synthase, component I [Streptomyces capoamus]|uniref:Aminodeoxychorismate synthase n=1 Tax=Streptomyces capoamus TaxID=68183 RepID=A0A919F4A5_9ACTN|nr:aminodeoxychorismate synthase component I [Streptomyces capoamus]GGW20723.1 aminodeoxychorismate synthase, component I [Streptomyces libani subsp. rufus]GHG75771.1 aminodeoxychorismate synthase, component I [Streptomyces capoamus]
MRTLLVDNYDSFTYNLFHHLTEVNGREPEVVRNDDPHFRPAHLAAFDNVVLSPGPGHPARAADFGVCAGIVTEATVPVLGVCLGHQGIALLHGATVGRAPEPRHGRTSPVLHDGTDLFAGVPSPFRAVRYHSLTVTDLPACLEPTAWTPDGILMGLRHRTRPQWGLQFHPESVLSDHGRTLLRNFAALTRSHRSATAVSRHPSTAPRAATAPAGPAPLPAAPAGPTPPATRRLRVLTRRLRTRWEDEVVYDRLFRGGDHAFWLDSSRPDGHRGRFSVMGDAGGPLARVVTADVSSGTVRVRSAQGGHPVEDISGGTFLQWLDRDLRSLRVDLPDLPCDFALGWVGYLGYELKAECGGDLAHHAPDPDATLVFADRALVLDHATGTTYLLALAEDGVAGSAGAAHAWLARTAHRLAGLAGVTASAPEAPTATGGITLRHDHDTYLRLIAACQEQIAAGETYEVCLTNMAEARTSLDPWQAYRLLRRTSPAPFAALLQFGPASVLSTSPERFLRVTRDGTLESSPIKGTRPRGTTPEQDAELIADLRRDEKDRSENLMIVDLVRNDLGRCAVPGSVRAEDIFQVETYATVHQLVSTVTARLRPGASAVDCVRAAFPPGSMTGAPKIRTMRVLDELEAGPRGVYSGAIGYFSLSGAADLSVVIRTARITGDRVTYGVGGAVVALSDPEGEYEETAVKAAPLTTLTGARFPDRTRRRIPS